MVNKKYDLYYLKCGLDETNRIIKYISNKEFYEVINNEILYDAVMFRLIQLAECIRYLSEQFKDKYSNIPWNKIKGFRNKVVHDYAGADIVMVRGVLTEDIYILQVEFNKILNN